MQPIKNSSIRELGRTRLKLRSDLVFTPRTFGGEPCYIVEDPVKSKFYRVGVPEYTFISLLDGNTPISQALALAARAQPDAAVTEQQAAVICNWLIETELAATCESSRPKRLAQTAEKTASDRGVKKWNPTIVRMPLLHPDRFFQIVSPWISWLYAPAALLPWLLLVAIAIYQVLSRWDYFAESSRGIFAPHNWLWLVLCWIVLKFAHELSHGVVCKRYAGTVPEMGIMLIMLAPVAYVDVTSSWRFYSKWHRIHTAAAGIYIELLLAAIATFVWSATETGPLNLLCFNAVIMASFTTLLFNANPLMKYDGYYILSDLLEIPNLYASGQQYLQYWARRYLLGLEVAAPRSLQSKRLMIQCYGIASFGWRVVFVLGLVLVSATFLRGAGIILSGIAAVMWLGWPALRFAKYLLHGTDTECPNRLRFFSSVAIGSAVIVLTFAAPWPGATQAPVVVEYSPLVSVRTGCAGFVRELLVRPGDHVEQGEIMARLENDELTTELADLVLARQQSQLKARSLEKKGHMAAYQAEIENFKAIETKYGEKQSQVDQLTLRAPCTGTVIGHNLETWIGRYAKTGSEILSVGNDSTLELRLSIAQDDLDAFKGHIDKDVRVRLPGISTFSCPLVRLNPRAAIDLPYACLASLNGGPLAVRAKEHATDASDPSRPAADQFELLSPRFTGVMAPKGTSNPSLHAGQLGIATIRCYDESIGRHLYRAATRWTEKKLTTPQNRTG